jgi:hypothetical protein
MHDDLKPVCRRAGTGLFAAVREKRFRDVAQRIGTPCAGRRAESFRVYGLLLVCKGLTLGGRFDCSRVSGLSVVPLARDHDGLFAR